MEAAERLYGPYRWDRYDVLVLPPSFPFGGMENPRLTFATPTVLAGDKSLVSLIAHELAHSWSGNLVTNATWSDFWLNEGFTTYIERRIVEEVYGPRRPDMEAVLGRQDLEDEIARPRGPRPDPAHRPHGARPGRGRHAPALREGGALPALARGALRAGALRPLPARLLRPLRVPEHHDGGLRRVPARAPVRRRRRPVGLRSSRGVDRAAGPAGGRARGLRRRPSGASPRRRRTGPAGTPRRA